MAVRVATTRAPASGAPEASVARPLTTPVAASWARAVDRDSIEKTTVARIRVVGTRRTWQCLEQDGMRCASIS